MKSPARRNLFTTSQFSNRASAMALGGMLLITLNLSAQAGNIYWDGTSAGWDSTTNWSTLPGATTPDPLAVPGSGDTAIFNITTVNGTETISLNANQAANGVIFNNTGTTTLQGGGTDRTLTLGSGGLTANTSAGTVTIGSATAGQKVAITLGASQTWTGDVTAGITVVNTVTGASGGPTTLKLAGSGGSNVFTNSITDGASGGVVSILKTGTGTWTLQNSTSGGFSYSGNTTISQGTFQIQVGGKQIGTSFNNTVAVLGGGTLNLSQNGTNTNTFKGLTINAGASSVTRTGGTGTGTLDFGGTTTSNTSGSTNKSGITRNVGGTVNFAVSGEALTAQANTNGIIGGYATVGDNWATSAGNGTTVSGAITTYSGYTNDVWASGNNTTVTSSGSIASDSTTNSLRFAAVAANTLTLAGTNTITSGGILLSSAVAANATVITGGSLQGAAGADLIVILKNAGGLTIASNIVDNTSATGLTKSGATGTLTLTGTNAYTGATYVNEGILQVGNGTSGSINSTSAITLRTGTLLGLNLAGNNTMAATISGEGSITTTGSGITTLSGNSSYSGVTTITSGTLKIGNVNALGTSALGVSATFTGTLDVNGFAITNSIADKALNGGTLTNTGAAVDLTGMGTIGASTTRAFNFDGTGNMTFGQQITGNGAVGYSITKNGSNTVTLSGTAANNIVAMTVNNGTLLLAKTGVQALNNSVTVNSDGTVQLGGSGGDQIGGAVTVASGGVFDLNGQSETVGALNLAGTGISSGGSLVNNNGSTTSTITGAVTLTAAASVGGSANVTVASAIGDGSNGLGLTKVGAGTLTLSSANTYTGATAVNAGNLLVTTSLASSAVTVSNFGTVLATDAAATIGNALTINSGAILAAGDAGAAGTATVGGASTFNNDSIFSWDINSTGTGYDKLVSTGLSGQAETGDAIFRIVAADSTFSDPFWTANRSWTDIFTTNGTAAIANWANLFSVSVVNSSFSPITPTNGSFSISSNTLTWTAVPEPTTALAGVLLGAGLLRRRREVLF